MIHNLQLFFSLTLVIDIRASNRTRHIALRERYVSEKAAEGMVKIVKVSSSDQVADMFTKALSQNTLTRHCSALGLSLSPCPSATPPPSLDTPSASNDVLPTVPPVVLNDTIVPTTLPTCLLCRAEFPSKNRLHAHIRASHTTQ